MEIATRFEVPYAIDAVWRCFHDAPAIVACLPGAGLSGPPEDGRLPLSMSVRLGPIQASFAGEAQLQLDEQRRTGSVSGAASDRKSGSRVRGSAQFSLHALDAPACGTRVELRVEYAIAGSLAQFSRGGIVQDLAARLTQAFGENLKARLDADQADAAPPVAEAAMAGAMAPAATPPVAPIDLFTLLRALLWRRLCRLFGRLART